MTRLDGVPGRNPPCHLVTTFHEPDLTDDCFEDGLPLAPTPLPRGARGRYSLSRFAGEGWGEGGPWLSHVVLLRRSLFGFYFPVLSGSLYVSSIGSAEKGSSQ